MFRSRQSGSRTRIGAIHRCVLSCCLRLMLLLVAPAAILLAPATSSAAESETCAVDSQHSEDGVAVSQRQKFRRQRTSRRTNSETWARRGITPNQFKSPSGLVLSRQEHHSAAILC